MRRVREGYVWYADGLLRCSRFINHLLHSLPQYCCAKESKTLLLFSVLLFMRLLAALLQKVVTNCTDRTTSSPSRRTTRQHDDQIDLDWISQHRMFGVSIYVTKTAMTLNHTDIYTVSTRKHGHWKTVTCFYVSLHTCHCCSGQKTQNKTRGTPAGRALKLLTIMRTA